MSTVNGLPAHILLVHAIVVLLPLAALLLVLTAVWPAARRRFAGPNAILSVLVVALVPVTTDAGEWLEHRVDETALLRAHTELGDTAIWAAVPVALLALVIWWRHREAGAGAGAGAGAAETGGSSITTATRRRTYLAPLSTTLTRIVMVLAVVIAGFAVLQTYRIGDSGSKAAWTDSFTSAPAHAGSDRPDGD
ncbi:hypothetical protein GCM10010172_65300 [Paractinoplanes ferrugineus]|uniref:Uncharacterized protein n=1 Tax=Paractinoplanes ferrugineus TaxID=113564 RepID=A0A919MFZ5_9ACTN|nr:DUF2231 domain-containing protein [Actinoplanes ferrugineus]GIE13309.1 hypothetical protein Afe05nite_51490 [Actinoplanes ferrugineus]